jgi:hypothetical protein
MIHRREVDKRVRSFRSPAAISQEASADLDARPSDQAMTRLALWAWPAALAAFVAAAAVALRGLTFGDAAPGRLLIEVSLCSLLAHVATRGRGPRARATLTIFLAALAARLVAVLVLDEWTVRAGGAFVVSPDAAGYDFWARRLFESWSTGEWPDIRRYDMAGRWDVGFEHGLAAAYGIFGESALLGRTLTGLFGALAAVFFWLVSLELVPTRVAVWAGAAYALWPSSAAWSAWSVLRDSLVWALLYAGIWCALRIARDHGGYAFALAFAGAFLALRLVRPYAAILLAAGLGLAFALGLVSRWRGIGRAALLLASAMFGAEAVLAVIGAPSVVRAAISVVRKDAVLHRWSDFEAPPEVAATWRIEPESDLRPGAGAGAGEPSWRKRRGRFLEVSLAGNAARFVFGPLAWMPTGSGDARSQDWLLASMWFWYAGLPLAAVGFVLGLARHPAFRPIAVVALALGVALTVSGEGTFYRQREMLVPVVLLAGAIGLEAALRRPRLLAATLVSWALLFGAGIALHIHLSHARSLGANSRTPRSSGAAAPHSAGAPP